MHAQPRGAAPGRPLLHAQLGLRRKRSGAGAALDGAVGTVGVDVERASRALYYFARDHDLFDAFETWKIEHGLQEDAFENGAQAAPAGLALDRPAGNRAKR